MQKIATRIFIYSSISFGIIGILLVWTSSVGEDAMSSGLNIILHNLLLTTVCVILPSFALSVAGKYLKQ